VERLPAIVNLAVHLKNGQRIYFDPNYQNQLVNQLTNASKMTLTGFELCKTDPFASTHLYVEVHFYFTWNNKKFQRF